VVKAALDWQGPSSFCFPFAVSQASSKSEIHFPEPICEPVSLPHQVFCPSRIHAPGFRSPAQIHSCLSSFTACLGSAVAAPGFSPPVLVFPFGRTKFCEGVSPSRSHSPLKFIVLTAFLFVGVCAATGLILAVGSWVALARFQFVSFRFQSSPPGHSSIHLFIMDRPLSSLGICTGQSSLSLSVCM
jgi:hypothetical protein